MNQNECFIKKFTLVNRNMDLIVANMIKKENLPILKNHAILFKVIPDAGVYICFHELLKECDFSKSALSEIITKYEKMGFMNKLSNAEDKRSIYIHLTPAGEKIKQKLKKIELALLNDLMKDIEKNEENLLNKTVDTLLANTNKML